MIRINLLKPGKKELKETLTIPTEEVKEKKKLELSKFIIIPFVILIVALFFIQRSSINKEKNLLRNAQEEKRKLQHVFSKLQKLEQQKALYEKKINLINQLKSQQETSVIIMDELSKHLPEWVWLTQASFDKQRVQIKGNALSNNLIADYIANLENSDYFINVNLISSTQKKIKNDRIQEFSLTARYILPHRLVPKQVSQNKTPEGKKQ